MSYRKDMIWLGCFFALLMLAPAALPNNYFLTILILGCLHSLNAVGLCLLVGHAGQISLGHAGFYGLAAYASAWLSATAGWPVEASMLAGVALTVVVSVLIGMPSLKLKGHYLAMATLGLNYVVHTVLLQWDEVTGGPSGFAGIPSLNLAGTTFDDPISLHYLLWSFAMVCLLLCLNLVRSGVGRGLAALAGDETAAASLGVDTRAAKVKVFVLSAVLASLAGSLYAHCYQYVSPDTFGIFASTDFVIMVVVGGMGSIWGSVFGAAFLTLMPEWMEFFNKYKDFVHGGILVLVLMFLPQGLITGLTDIIRVRLALWRRDHASA